MQFEFSVALDRTNCHIRATWLLRTTNMTIVQIYSNVGYDSEASFYQNFKSTA